MGPFTRHIHFARSVLILTIAFATPVAADSWPDGDPAAIWDRAPGFYKEEDTWYAIIHVPASVERVRLFGDFTNGRTNAMD